MDHVLTPVGLNVFQSTLRAAVIAATTPDINPLLPIIRTPIVVDELLLRHFPSLRHNTEGYLARG
jgi:hypothetical protein